MTYIPRYFVGADPGAKGGIAVHETEDGGPVITEVIDMPLRNGRLDPYPVAGLSVPPRNFIAVIEKVHAMPTQGRKQGAQGMFNFGRAFGGLETFFDYTARSLVLVAPVTWKKWYGLGKEKEDAIKMANELFGEHEMWNRVGKRGGSMLDQNSGCAEAALIAHYGWRQAIGS